jgi:hypothetical protein
VAQAGATIKQKLTLWEALNDVGWFPALYASVVGGPSVLAILELALDGFRLVPAVQWIIDGYHQITRVMGLLIEPLFAPLIAWINGLLGWSLVLQPHWQPLFLLGMVIVTSMVRTDWRDGRVDRRKLFLESGAMGFAFLVAAVIAGLVPVSGSWWVHGLMVSLMIFAFFVGSAVDGRDAAIWIAIGGGVGAFFFLIAAVLSLVPGVGRGSGILVLAGCVAVLGIVALVGGISQSDRSMTRSGLTMLGGFVAAGLILAADAIVKAFGAG